MPKNSQEKAKFKTSIQSAKSFTVKHRRLKATMRIGSWLSLVQKNCWIGKPQVLLNSMHLDSIKSKKKVKISSLRETLALCD
jgi:hypothetical protein